MKTLLLLAVLQSFAPAQNKKCITVAWEFIYTSPTAIAQHADQYRGCGLSGAVFNLFGKLADGTKLNTNRLPEDPPWTREAFASDEAALKQLSKLPEFSFSFIDAVRCPRKRHAWTDDAFWADYCTKVGIVASIAKNTGMVGLAVDNEDYGQSKQFYLQDGDGDYETVAKLARQRGREIFSSIFEKFPTALVHFDRMYANELWNYYYGAEDPRAHAQERGDLWIPFLDGALEALPEGCIFYEGDESGYRYDSRYHDALDARARNTLDLARVVSPELRQKYRAQVRVAIPVYLDRYDGQKPNSRYWCSPANGSLMAQLERNLTDALTASDDYVWLYAETSFFGDWVRPEGDYRGLNRRPTWESRMPGLTDILNVKQHPREFAARRINALRQTGKLRNLIPEKFADGRMPSPLNPWQAKKQPGVFGAKEGVLFAEGVGAGGISWSVSDVKEGDLYAVEFEVRGRIGATLVNFHRQNAAHDLTFPVPQMFEPPAGSTNAWLKSSFVVRVPQAMSFILFSINVRQKPGERTEVRNLVCTRLMRLDGTLAAPKSVHVEGEGFAEDLQLSGDAWIGDKTFVRLVEGDVGTMVKVTAPGATLKTITIKWTNDFATNRVGTNEFLLLDRGDRTCAWGAKPSSKAKATWRVRPDAVETVLDLTQEGCGIQLEKSVLDAAILLRREGIPGEAVETASQAFARMMSVPEK